MPQRSVLSWRFDPVRGRRKRPRPAGSVSDFVARFVEPECIAPAAAPPRLVALPPPSPPPGEIDGRLALAATRNRQLELENNRLRRLVGDLMLEKEILQAAVRRRVADVGLQIAS
ncbi:MAG: hypothetical protein ABW360_14250 [Phenylobacterium sp.]